MPAPFWSVLWSLLGLLLVLQVLGLRPILLWIVNRRFGDYVSVSFRGLGFFAPLLRFSARDLRVIASGTGKRDRIYVEAAAVSFWVDPVHLLFGRLRAVNLQLDRPLLQYVNRQQSHEKNRYVPGRNRVELKNARIRGGSVYVQDETLSPVYRIALTDINLEGGDMDVGTSIDVFFRSRRGTARIASGFLEIAGEHGRGTIRVWGSTWGELTGVGDLPLMRGRLALEAYHSGGSDGRRVEGILANIPASDEANYTHFHIHDVRTQMPFSFELDWNEYGLTFDLALLKLIQAVLTGARAPSMLRGGVLSGVRGLFEVFRKQEK